MENIRVSKCVHYDGPHVNLLHIMMHWTAAYIQYMEYILSVSCICSVHRIRPISQLHTCCKQNTSCRSAAYIQCTEYFPLVSCIYSVYRVLPIGQLHTCGKQNTSHCSAAYILDMEYFPSASCIHSVHGTLPIGQLHTFCTWSTSHQSADIFCRWHTSHQWAAHIQYTEYFPSVSCIHSVHGILPISQLHTFCTRNTSHWSTAYVLYMAYFPSVSCIHSVNRILPLICTTQKNISIRITEMIQRLIQFTKALMYKWDVMIAHYP